MPSAGDHAKGAVYANFAGKEALFLALLDRHLDDQLAQVDRPFAAAPDTDLRAGLHDASTEQMTAGGSFGLLMLQHLIDPEAITPQLRANALMAVIDPPGHD